MIVATGASKLRSFSAERAHRWLDTWSAFVLLCFVAITPLLVVDFPPLVDLYGHLGRYAVQTDLPNRPELQPYFSYEWRLIGNLGADLLVEVLHTSFGLEPAVRFIVILTQLLAAAGILLLSRELHGRITPFAVAALPLIYGLPFNYGFLNFSLSMALGMLAFVMWLRLRRTKGAIASGIWLAVTGMAVWICHAYGWAFLGLLCGSTMMAEAIAAKKRPLAAVHFIVTECWTLLLPLGPIIIWRTDSGGISLLASSFSMKLQGLVSPLRTKWVLVDAPSLFPLVASIYWAVRTKAVRLDMRLSIAALLAFVFFLILPKQVFGSMAADVRLMPYVLLTAMLAIPTQALSRKSLRILTFLSLAFFAARMLTTAIAYAQYDEKVNDVLPALESIPRGSRVAFFSVAPCKPSWALPVLDHVAGFAHARRSVFINNQWHVPGASPLVIHYEAAGDFAHDPAHLVLADGCDRDFYPSLSEAFARFPFDAFTHVWMVGELPGSFEKPERLEPMPHAGKGALFAVRNSNEQ
jgi:hypothetical protein